MSTVWSRLSSHICFRNLSADTMVRWAFTFDAAAVITTLVLLGQVLELRARSKTSRAIKALLGLAPKTARLIRDDGTEVDVPLERVKPGDRLGFAQGKKFRWTEWFLRARRPSMSR